MTNPNHNEQWRPDHDIAPLRYARTRPQSELEGLTEALLHDGIPEISDYIGYPDIQRGIAHEMAQSMIEKQRQNSTSDAPAQPSRDEIINRTIYVPYVEKLPPAVSNTEQALGHTALLDPSE